MRPTSLLASACLLAWSAAPAPSRAATLPPGFQDVEVLTGLTKPMAVRFAPDGRVFVAEKSGIIRVFDDLQDTTPTLFADLQSKVHNYWDRGLMGIAIDPAFPSQPYVYVSYAYDFNPATPSLPAPRWGDACPTPPGPNDDGCVISGRVSRLKIRADNTQDGPEQVLLENNWCQQFPSHSMGQLGFGPEGALYVSAGDGASFRVVDYGQNGGTQGSPPPIPKNPCGDPPSGSGGTQTLPTAEGGALRAQDFRSPSDALSWNGSVLRIDPVTGNAWPGNPNSGGSADDDRTIAFGLRNPFRWTFRPGTSEMWLGDVGWDDWEEINRLVDPAAGTDNFGWPCYEGAPRQAGYDAADANLCESLYGQGAAAVVAPYFSYAHRQPVYPGDPCGTGNSSISGLAFYAGGEYPAAYDDALFFTDHSRVCMWVMTKGANGLPDPSTVAVFETGTSEPVDLLAGPGGDLFYVDHEGGKVHRITFTSGNTPPTAVAAADPRSGAVPLTVQFDGSGSSDPDAGSSLTYAWDLDADGAFDDATIVDPARTYTAAGQLVVRLRVTDDQGAPSVASVVVSPGNHAPVATVSAPSPALLWGVGDVVAYSGSGQDQEDGALPASAMHWDIVMHHCPSGTSDCHEHLIESHDEVAGGTFVAPDHDFHSFLEFRLEVSDLAGLVDAESASIEPKTAPYTFASSPPGATLTVGAAAGVAPFGQTLIVGSTNTVSAVSLQTLAGTPSYWSAWSDGGARSHGVVAAASATTLTATYLACAAVETCVDGADNDCDGVTDNGTIPVPVGTFRVDRTQMSWTALPGADTYDVVRGSLNGLRNSGGDFAAWTQECLRNDYAATSFPYSSSPGASSGQWYIVRANNCAGAGSWDDGSPTQSASRDAEIASSPLTCP